MDENIEGDIRKDDNNFNKKKHLSYRIITIFCCMVIIITVILLYYIYNHTYKGDFQEIWTEKEITVLDNSSKYKIIDNYDDYIDYIETIKNYEYSEYYSDTDYNKFEAKYDEEFFNNNSLVLTTDVGWEFEVIDVTEKNSNVKIQIYSEAHSYAMSRVVYFIPVSKEVTTATITMIYYSTYSTIKNVCIAIIIISLIIIIGTVLRIKYIKRKKSFKTSKYNNTKILEVFEIIVAIFIGGPGLLLLLYMIDDCFFSIPVILVAIGLIALATGLIIGLEKGKKTLKIACAVIGIILSLLFVILMVMIYQNAKDTVLDKPIIYLYPEEETEVSVELGYSENITVSYPKYLTGWNVLAKTDGTLIDLDTNRQLYSLYYESESNIDFEVTSEGFVVKGEDVAEFLEEKLEILGLNERESEEFIIYWLPVLQENEYNYIRFATTEEIEENMPLIINPNPDTVIRVLMTYKGLEKQIEVEEQELETPERTGFVAVEWGGTEIN